MADYVSIMVTAIVIAVFTMLFASTSIADFVERHPTVKMMARSLLLLLALSFIDQGHGGLRVDHGHGDRHRGLHDALRVDVDRRFRRAPSDGEDDGALLAAAARPVLHRPRAWRTTCRSWSRRSSSRSSRCSSRRRRSPISSS